ncbi:hypothetical protein EDB87DRAFT_1744395 [Lactarius vividus]|nr:hypothetical protein EDB87DRAFT_1744395 [Lactarius vividus]
MSAQNHPSDFDALSFIKYMKNIGRAYRKQATELVSICRLFARVGEQSPRQHADLTKVLTVADDALTSASESKNRTSKKTDKKFEEALDVLSVYEQKYHPKQQGAAERLKSAKEKDKSSSNFLSKLVQRSKAKPVEGTTKVVEFLLPGSLPDPSPHIIKQELGEKTSVEEILWNFSRLKDRPISLRKNPHFYSGLPGSACDYHDKFTMEPIENFHDATEIWVLTDKQSRVFLEAGEKKRVFGNFWVPDKAIIFKGPFVVLLRRFPIPTRSNVPLELGGRLEGEHIVAKDIQGTPNLWHRVESQANHPSVGVPATGPANPSDLPPIITNPLSGKMFEDWRHLIRHTLKSPNISVCISTNGSPPDSQDHWFPSSPINPTPSSPAQPFSALQADATGASSGISAPPKLPTLQIPVSSPGPQTAQSFKSALSTFSPDFRTPLTVILPPFSPPSTTSHWGPSAAAPPSPARRTPISQDSPVAFSVSMSLTMATRMPPQTRLLPSVIAGGPEPPPQQAASTETALISSGPPTTSGIASPPPETALPPSTNNLSHPSGPPAGSSQVVNRSSAPLSVHTNSNTQALSPGQKRGESAAAPVGGPAQTQGKQKNWFQKYIWDYGKK